MKMRIWLGLGLLLIVVAGVWALRHSEPAAKAPTRQVNIRTQTVKQSLAEPTLKLVGKLAVPDAAATGAPAVCGGCSSDSVAMMASCCTTRWLSRRCTMRASVSKAACSCCKRATASQPTPAQATATHSSRLGRFDVWSR